MLDFITISIRQTKSGVEIYPKFIIKKSSDLMIRGGDFYAVWIEERGLWSTDEQDLFQMIDRELDIYAEKNKEKLRSYTCGIASPEWSIRGTSIAKSSFEITFIC